MSKRPSDGDQAGHRKKRQSKGQIKNYKSSVKGIASRRTIDGPGIWAMTVKGKEKQATNELYEIIESISNRIWPKPPPTTGATAEVSEDESDEEEDIEKQLANELSNINKPKTKDITDRRIVIYIATKPPIDPVEVVLEHMKQVSQTGVSGTRALVRLVPASVICPANMPAITSLATDIFTKSFAGEGMEPKKYKIELRIRSHKVLTRDEVIKAIAQCVPSDKGHTVDLTNQDTTILVELFKGICTISVVPNYEKYKRFNVVQIVQEEHKKKEGLDSEETSRVAQTTIAKS
ncbi:THUMP domain protein [Rhizoctonia solani AG-3 Rhs1AP]|uniref:THUMP domain protein n=1 Tax=Rhizoctonia solani AG-3 Rhs1AP TaxID=1086054 RepID=X8JQ13_9AGAM|nr:THUMP domain protein [Rhizoctonia solani AG-3 Rhs1AP]